MIEFDARYSFRWPDSDQPRTSGMISIVSKIAIFGTYDLNDS